MGQLHLERLQVFLELGPEVVLFNRIDILVQIEHHDGHAVATDRGGLLLVHFLVREHIGFQGLGDLLLHLFRTGTGINRHHHALTYREDREFLLGHHHQGISPENHGDNHDEDY